jgi:hypothetical protein
MALIYGLYSTRDGRVRYVGQSEYTARKRLDRWITDALDRKTGAVAEWIQAEWRDGFDVEAWVLQDEIIPADLEMFECHWIEQFAGLLNRRAPADPARAETEVGRQMNEAIAIMLRGKQSEASGQAR